MKKSFFILIVILTSCFKGEYPDNILSQDEMVSILIEVHLLEAKIQKLYLKEDSSKVLYDHYEDMLFDDLEVDREKYNNSMIYYVDNGYEMGKIYDRVVDSLLAIQQTHDD